MAESVVLVVCDPETRSGKQLYRQLLDDSTLTVEALKEPEAIELRLLAGGVALLVVDALFFKESGLVSELFSFDVPGHMLPPLLVICDKLESFYELSFHWQGATDWLLAPFDIALLGKRVELLLTLCRLQNETGSLKKELEARSLELEVMEQELLEKTFRLESLSSTDSLTGLFNNFYFDENLEKEWKQGIRQGELLSLLMISVDGFSAFREKHGSKAADEMFRVIATTLHQTLLRPVDIVARYSAEQFAVLLPGTDEKGAELVARRMAESFAAIKETSLMVSTGGATLRPAVKNRPEELLELAEQALVKARTSKDRRLIISKRHEAKI